MGRITLFLFAVVFAIPAHARVASVGYVEETIAHKVDASEGANQTMAGTYTVSGSFDVPTPPLPTAD